MMSTGENFFLDLEDADTDQGKYVNFKAAISLIVNLSIAQYRNVQFDIFSDTAFLLRASRFFYLLIIIYLLYIYV